MEDGDGRTLSGANKYTLTFPKGRTPPVDGFWSITMYFNDGGWWFYPNPLNKFTVSLRDKPNIQRRRLADPVLPERVAWQGQGSQLAAGPEGRLHPDDAHVLAEGEGAVDPASRSRLVGATAGGAVLLT